MESISLELKVMSCKDLKAFNFFQKLTVYALVSIISDDPDKKLEQKQQNRTPADKEGDGNPEWNQEMRFDLKEVSFYNCDHLFIHFELRHEGAMFGDKNIGEVRVPCKDLLQESNMRGFKFVNYEVRSMDGKPNGVLTFAYKVNGNVAALGANSPVSEITGFAIADHYPQMSQTPYPPLEVHNSIQVPSVLPQTSETQYLPLNVHSSTQVPPVLPQTTQILYPPLEVHSSPPQVPYPVYSSPTTTQDFPYLPPLSQQPSQENYYPPPEAYYSPPPPPPPPLAFPHPHLPPPPPPMAHGAFYPPPPPPPPHFQNWAPDPHMGFHNHNRPESWGSSSGHSNAFENGNGWTPPNHFSAWSDRHSSSWNGR